MMRKVFLFLPVFLLLSIVVASQTAAQGVPAQIRVANYAPGSPVIEFWMDGAFSGIQTLKAGEVSGWVQLPPGQHSFSFNAVGGGVLVGPFGLNLAAGSFSTIAMGGGPDVGYFVTLAKENYVKPLDPVNARLTVVNSVVGLRSGLDLITADGTVLISNILPGRSASVDLGIGVYDLRVVPTGTSGAGLNAYNLRLQPKTYYLMSAVRTDNGAGLAMTGMSEAPVEGLIASASQAGDQTETSVIASSGGGGGARPQRPRGDGLPPNLPPPPTLAVPVDVLSTINADPRLTRLASAIKLVGMDQALSGPGPFTVFAPTDRAFAQVNSERVQTKGALRDVLTYHIVHDRIEIGQMFDQMTLLTTQGSFLRLTRYRNTFEVNNVRITSDAAPMVTASNGLIYILDQVLLPPNIAPTLAPSPTPVLRITATPAALATSTPQG